MILLFLTSSPYKPNLMYCVNNVAKKLEWYKMEERSQVDLIQGIVAICGDSHNNPDEAMERIRSLPFNH